MLVLREASSVLMAWSYLDEFYSNLLDIWQT